MRTLPLQRAISLAIAALAWTACGGGVTGAPAAALQAPAIGFADDGTIYNVSGQYAGRVKDSVNGTAALTLNLAQYRSSVGGSLAAKSDGRTQRASATYALNGTDLRGTMIVVTSSLTCVFNENAKYDSSTHRLSASYHSFHGCGGKAETGTFTAKQQCYYARDWAIRPDAGGLKMC